MTYLILLTLSIGVNIWLFIEYDFHRTIADIRRDEASRHKGYTNTAITLLREARNDRAEAEKALSAAREALGLPTSKLP